MTIIQELKDRDILYAATNEKKVNDLKGKGVYIGFDPTAKSLHLGNYIQIVLLLRFKNCGYKPYIVLGGATGMIGDPSGKSAERNLVSKQELEVNKSSITKQLQKFKIKVVDNYTFYEDMNVLDFLRDVGKLLNVNYMMNKEVVKHRLDSGISFTEFSYQLLQGWDFYQLYKKHAVALQAGGSDQWGNITSGLEIIRKMSDDKEVAAGVTTKLLAKSDGQKFGKTADGEVIWLDQELTTFYKVYQYFLNQPDADVERLLKWLTFQPISQIKKVMQRHLKEPFNRIAQKELAKEVLIHIHGQEAFKEAEKISEILFDKFNKEKITEKQIESIAHEITTIKAKQIKIIDALIETKLATSKREAREFIKNGAISVNGETIKDEEFTIKGIMFNKKWTLLKRGKRLNALIRH